MTATQAAGDDAGAVPLFLFDLAAAAKRLPLYFAASDERESGYSLTDDESTVKGAVLGRVLIVEDEALVALDMAMILNSAGYQVMGTKPTGDSALIALNAAATDGIFPDLVLMDIALRGALDGIETTKQIKSKYPGVPVAFVTGQADPITRARAEATGPAGYLLKPFTPEQLVAFIENVLAGR